MNVVPLLKIVPLDTVLAKLLIAKPQLIFSQEVVQFVAPIAVRCSASNCERSQGREAMIFLKEYMTQQPIFDADSS